MEPYLGELRVFGFGLIPRGFAACNGQLLSIQQNSALFSLLGTYYGGNGVSTFALPDLRSSTPVNMGTYPGGQTYVIGEKAGTENVTVLQSEMPVHTHNLNAQTSLAAIQLAAAGAPRKLATGAKATSTDTINMYSNANTGITALEPATIGLFGGNQPHSNMPPFLVLNVCIALQGIYPSRN